MAGQIIFWRQPSLAREAADAGRTVFLSSHVLDEVQHVADRVAVLRAYARYLPQLDPTVHPVSVVDALAANPAAAVALSRGLTARS